MKKIVLALLVMSLSAMAFAAPVSNKKVSTNNLFKTDVDNFADVNNWDSVQPENLFGFMGYKNSAIDFGLAHQFKKFYGAFYFNGTLGSVANSTVETTVTGASTSVSKTKGSDSSQLNGNFRSGVLFGFGDIGLNFDLMYSKPTYSYTETSTETTVKNGAELYEVYPTVKVGFNNKTLKSWNAEYNAYLGYDANVNKTYSADVTTDDSVSYFSLGGGMNLSKGQEKKIDEINLGLNMTFGIYPSTVSSGDNWSRSQTGKSMFAMSVYPEYVLTYNANEKTTLKTGVGAYVSLNTSKTAESYSVSGATDYSEPFTTQTTIGMYPTLSAGISYAPEFKKIKFPVDLNAGIGLRVPTMAGVFKKTENRDDKGNVLIKTDSKSFIFNSSDGSCWFTSGFTAKPLNFLTLDCTYNVLSSFFGSDFTSDFSEGDGTNFWNTVNKVMVHNVTILVSAKL